MNAAEQDDKPKSFEAALTELEETVRALESGELPLESALEQFEKGVRLLRECEGALKHAEQKVEILLGDRSQASLEPFTSQE